MRQEERREERKAGLMGKNGGAGLINQWQLPELEQLFRRKEARRFLSDQTLKKKNQTRYESHVICPPIRRECPNIISSLFCVSQRRGNSLIDQVTLTVPSITKSSPKSIGLALRRLDLLVAGMMCFECTDWLKGS